MIHEIVFMGTGTSGSVPNIYCLTNGKKNTCRVCRSALQPSTHEHWPSSKNRRRNTSLLLRYRHAASRQCKNVVIDCGKTFYDSALQWFVQYQFRQIDACLITHGHADAMFGMDDLRQWTIGNEATAVQSAVDVHVDPTTMDSIAAAFPYLVNKQFATGGGDVPSLQYHLFEKSGTFTLHEQERVTPLPVEHGVYSDGEPYMAYGFRMRDFAYISDVSAIPTETLQLLMGCDVLVLDGLRPTPHASHQSIAQSLLVGLVHQPQLRPRLVLLTDFCHAVDHDELEAELRDFRAMVSGWAAASGSSRPAWNGRYVLLGEREWAALADAVKRLGAGLVVPEMRAAWDGMRLIWDYPDAPDSNSTALVDSVVSSVVSGGPSEPRLVILEEPTRAVW